MDDLPQVLQKEIWEYVRGDRARWKNMFQKVLWEIDDMKICQIHRHKNGQFTVLRRRDPQLFGIYGTDKRLNHMGIYAYFDSIDGATRRYHEIRQIMDQHNN